MEHSLCTEGTSEGGFYWESAITGPFIFFLQLLLLITTLCTKSFYTISIQARVLYILLQLTCLYWALADYLRYVLDPFYHFLPNTIFCDITAFTARAIGCLSYALYLYQILLRIQTSFGCSYLKPSNMTIFSFKLIIIVSMSAWVLALSVNHHSMICINSWEPHDVSHPLLYCDLPWTDWLSYAMLIALTIIAGLNIIFGAMFGIKLSKLRISGKQNEHHNAHFTQLILKNSILTLTGSTCTIISYMLWFVTRMGFWLYLDGLINSMVIGGMFNYNDRYYQWLCRPCIVLFIRGNTKKGKSRSVSGRLSVDLRNLEQVVSDSDGSPGSFSSSPEPTDFKL